jgi:phosphomannomutase
VVARPSGTEPKLKCYIEVRLARADDGRADDIAAARADAARLLARLTDEVSRW